MKEFKKIRVYAWGEFVIWLVIVAVVILGLRYHNYQSQKQYKNYQIFMEDVDGLIVGSPVKFLGIQIGYVKKIQIISTEVYIKFVVTQKDLVLPTGSYATVEFSGLGGSKALEIYPPSDKMYTDKIIAVKEPVRLNKVMGLFNEIFKELDSIITTIDHASSEFEKTEVTASVPKNVVTPVDASANLDKVNDTLDVVLSVKKKFIGKVIKTNKE